MTSKNILIRGTILLTTAGILSRLIGFFYRIFLANTIGAEGMGIYQLIFPIYSICLSLCASGIETAISKLTAEKMILHKTREANCIFKTGLGLSVALSLGCSLFLYHNAYWIAKIFLKDLRCTMFLKILSFTIPFASAHACFCGYYFGLHQAVVPAVSQLFEQIFRVFSVWILYQIFLSNHWSVSPAIAVIGIFCGEFSSFMLTITCFLSKPKKSFSCYLPAPSYLKEILLHAVPLTSNRIIINLLASMEAFMIPNSLKAYGMESAAALSVYGILNGMALPFILFPNALTGSISTLLLPTVSEYAAAKNINGIRKTLRKTFIFCLLLGLFFLIFFLSFGNLLGTFFFSNETAGNFITVLAWICPFLYLNSTLSATLNGLGLTHITFLNGICSLAIRICSIAFFVPSKGIHGYLFGLLASQLFLTGASIFFLKKNLKNNFEQCT